MLATRRSFLTHLTGSATVVSVGSQIPELWTFAAENQSFGSQTAVTSDTILVVVQLSGGNDGLNTVVPYQDAEYRKARPKLAISSDAVLKIDDQLGFHPSARGLADLLESNRLAIIQGVGYDRPNRSHFESMDIWHTCQRKHDPRSAGWLGRLLDGDAFTKLDSPGLHLGAGKLPLALVGRSARATSISSPSAFRLNDDGQQSLRTVMAEIIDREHTEADSLVDFLQSSVTTAVSASERITSALQQQRATGRYPENSFGQKLKTVGQLIAAELGTRVYYVELDGFDTHSRQPAAHAALLQQLADGTRAFLQDMEDQGQANRVLVMCFSEFGRRVEENASDGTDHGAAAPMFLMGANVLPGLIGDLPSLTDLDDGDLKFHTDFRQVYATVLQHWLGWNSSAVLGSKFKPIAAIRT